MIAFPERATDRDAALEALLVRVPTQGWTVVALRAALRDMGADPLDAELLFPGGAPEMIEAFFDLADRRMVADAAATDLSSLRTAGRVRAIIALWLQRNRVHREAVRRAMAILSLPLHAPLAARCTARTVDAIWLAAGDKATNFSWYTKRGLLVGVFASTLLYWLRDTGEDDRATLAFVDRRLAGIGKVGAVRKRAEDMLARACTAGTD